MNRCEHSSATPSDKALLKQLYLNDILSAKRTAALDRIMAAFHSGYSIPEIYMDIFQESLHEVGRLWETNRIGVAEEHVATAITQFIMSNLYQHLETADARRGRLVITGIQGELHQVGSNMVSDVLEADGWDVVFLGSDVSPESAIEAVRRHHADVLGISATLARNIPVVVDLVDRVKQEFGLGAPGILLGGGAFHNFSELPRELEGCIFARDLREAVEMMRKINIGGNGE